MNQFLHGVCEKCLDRVPAKYVFRDGRVFLAKDCPRCGVTEGLVSNDQAAWEAKRMLLKREAEMDSPCALQCHQCSRSHSPTFLFLELTNRCNMNCPICASNIPKLGFEYHPPKSYFERLLKEVSAWTPKPRILFFGGEPTVREDLFELLDYARSLELRCYVATNGLKLADEAYCKALCERRAQIYLGFDGKDVATYEKLRGSAAALDKKLKALENLKKYSRTKTTILYCLAKGINDKNLDVLLQECHENRNHIKTIHFLPMVENWEPGSFESLDQTTIEDAEKILTNAFPGENVGFVPAAIVRRLSPLLSFFTKNVFSLGGVHPSCETATWFFSDGERYRSIGHYLNRPLFGLVQEALERAEKLFAPVAKLDKNRFLHRLWGRCRILSVFVPLLLRSFRFDRVFRGSPFFAILGIVLGLVMGGRLKKLLKKYTAMQETLLMLVVPLEERHSIESARLSSCPSGFIYEEESGQLRLIPVCIANLYREQYQQGVAKKYGVATSSSAGH